MLGRRPRRQTSAVAAVAARFGRNVDDCLQTVERTVTRARSRGAELVVFPESALGGYLYEPLMPSRLGIAPPPALDPDGPEIRRLIEIAGPTVVCVGYTEAGPIGPYSSAVCVTGDGVLGRHRKVHLPPSERGEFIAGDGFSAFDTPIGRMGMLICYDKVFPESARELSLDGAGIIASLAAWPVNRADPAGRVKRDRQVRHFNLLDQARALENQVVWVSANQSGRLGRLRFPGQGKVVDPDGTVLATTGARSGTALAEVDVAGALDSVRSEISHLTDRRPSAYPLRDTAAAF
jgi:predicted amidohydrolase